MTAPAEADEQKATEREAREVGGQHHRERVAPGAQELDEQLGPDDLIAEGDSARGVLWLARAYQQLGRNDEANLHFELSRSLRGNKKSEEEQLFQQIPR